MNIKQNTKYAIAAPTSMGIRLTPESSQPVHTSNKFFMQATSAETNALSIAASLGCRTLALTAFVKNNPISTFIKNDLNRRKIEYFGKDYEQNGPWGLRHQINFADTGAGLRAPMVYNDRAGEVGREMDVDDFDTEKIFNKDGVSILHITGLIASISEKSTNLCLSLAKAAKKAGTAVAFDLNYRESFWKGRERILRESFIKIAQIADILSGNEEDFQLCLGLEGPNTSAGKPISKTDEFLAMISRLKKKYSKASVFTTSLRQVITVEKHLWGSIVCKDGNCSIVEPREIGVLDRIGGGDGFMGGVLYGLLNGWDSERCNQFGWSTGALAATLNTDYALPINEEQIWSIFAGNARVKR